MEVTARVVAQPGISMADPQPPTPSESQRVPERALNLASYIKCGLCPEEATPIARAELPAHVAAHRAAFDRDLAGIGVR